MCQRAAIMGQHQLEFVAERDALLPGSPSNRRPASPARCSTIISSVAASVRHSGCAKAIGETRQLRQLVLHRATQHQTLRVFQADRVADGREDRTHALLRPQQ